MSEIHPYTRLLIRLNRALRWGSIGLDWTTLFLIAINLLVTLAGLAWLFRRLAQSERV